MDKTLEKQARALSDASRAKTPDIALDPNNVRTEQAIVCEMHKFYGSRGKCSRLVFAMLRCVAPKNDTVPEDPAPPPKRRRVRRTFGTILATLGLTTVFACSVVVSLGLHLNLAPLRRIARYQVNRILETALEGKLIVEDFDHLSLGSVEIHSVVALDPVGRQTVRASGIKAQYDLRAFVREAIRGNFLLSLPLVQIADADVQLDRDEDGRLGIEKTFVPKVRKRATTTSKPSAKKKGTATIMLDRIEIAHASAKGNVTAPRNLDAEVTRLVAKLLIDQEKYRLDVEPTGVRERGLLPAEITGSGDYHLHIDFPPPATAPDQPVSLVPRLWSDFSGRAGNLEVLAHAKLDGKTISASLDMPRMDPADIKKLIPNLPIEQRTALKATFDGTYPTFDLDGDVELMPAEGPSARITLAGKLDVQGGVKAVVDLATTKVNARAFRQDLPDTAVNARAHVAFAAAPTPRFVAEASVEPTNVGTQSMPAIDAHAAFDHGILEGRVTLHEPGAPTRSTFVVEGRDQIRFDAETNVASLQAIPRLTVPLSGGGRAKVRGTIRGTELDAHVEGHVNSFAAQKAVELEQGHLEGRLHGPLNQLEVDAVIIGKNLRAGDNTADRVTVRAVGPVMTPSINAHLEGGDVEDLRASGRVDPQTKAIRGVEVRLSRSGEELRGKVTEVRADRGTIAARGLSLEGSGIGALGGTLVVANQDITGKLAGKNIDLERLSRLFGLNKRTRGIADIDIALAPTNRGRKGHINVNVKNATVAPMAGIEFPGTYASVNATFDHDRASVEASVRIDGQAKPGQNPATACEGTIAEVRVSEAEGALRGPLLAPSTWAKLTGHARVEAKDTRLDCIAQRLPLALLLTEVAGKLDASISVDRPAGQRFVSVKSLEVKTKGLKIAGPQMFGEEKPRWESRSMDVAILGSVDGSSGATSAKLILSDDRVLAELATTATLDLQTIVDDPRRRWATIAKSPGTMAFMIPRRSVASLKSLPSVFHDKLPPVEGDFAVTVTSTGTLEDPSIAARVSTWHLGHVDEQRQPSEWSLPVDADVVANYKGKKAGLVAQVRRNTREIASVVGNAEVDLNALLLGSDVPPNFDVQTTLTRLPLGRLPYFTARGVNATVSGTIQIGQHGDQRTAKARLSIPQVRLNDEPTLERAGLSLDITPATDDLTASHGTFEVELAGRDGGKINVAGYSGVDWSAIVPHIKEDKAAGLSIQSSDFQLSSLQPVVSTVFSRFGGKLDGQLNVATTMYGDDTQGHIESNMELTNGVVHIPQIGQELKNAHFVVRSREQGSLQFDDIQAEGISGRIYGSATAKMKGLVFQSSKANFTIDKSESLPITFEGVPLGQAYGKLSVEAEKLPREMRVWVKLTDLHLALPASSSRAVQSLEPHPDIIVSHAIGQKKEPRREDALAWITTVDLGTTHIEGMGVDMKLTSPKESPLRIELRQDARMSGEVQVVGGTFEVIGKKFEIERGLVRLREEEAGNPYVNITARWDAPEGTRVYVDYAGVLKPITEQKLRFRSDPPLTQQAILAMVLSGGSSGSTGEASEQGSANATDLAANVVGGEIASTQINAVLSQIAPLRGLSTRLGTSDSGRLRTTVMYELGDTVKAEASYEGLPSGSRLEGIQTDVNDPYGTANRTEINIDWRFYKNWSLRGSFGFGGVNQQPSSGLDVLWQYRY